MPLGPFGGIHIGNTRLTTDPKPYEPLNWPKRMSVHPAIGGKLTIQDFGTFMRDNTLKLASGDTRVLDEETMTALHAKYRLRGAVYTMTDWLGNEFTVFIKSFRAWPRIKGAGPAGAVSLWDYEMELHVLLITKLLGVDYVDPS